ncbi:hypothetical protein J6590_022680 [Homalodisca vitripennis]|nr:hypothetical protein J6590_022680 [Homalodisca vitripennis]
MSAIVLVEYVHELLVSHLDEVIIHLGEKEWGQSRAVQTNREHAADQSRAVPTKGVDSNRRRERVGAEPSSTDKSRKFVDWSEPSSYDKH